MSRMNLFLKTIFSVIIILLILSHLQGAQATMTENTGNLPKTIGGWTRPDDAQIVDATNIFDYMNGAGELYLAYRFDHLEVYEYAADQQDAILAEVYVMETPADAFGLLSLDWGGESVTLSPASDRETDTTITPPIRALYGGGLLRVWADTIYARVMAYRETPEAKEAVLALGQAIAANRAMPPVPELLQAIPQAIGTAWKVRQDRIGYFRSYLVLNSLYYLSHENILNLDHTIEAVTAPYEASAEAGSSKRPQLLIVKYATPEQARQALNAFHDAYLSEHPKGFEAGVMTQHANAFKIEDGWVGYRLNETCLAIVLECPDQESAQQFMEQSSCNTF